MSPCSSNGRTNDMRALVVLAAIVFKIWFVGRMMTPQERAHVVFVAACWLLVAIMAAIWMQRTEPKGIGEPFCSDRAQRRIDYDFEYCEFKQRDVRLGASRSREVMFATQTI